MILATDVYYYDDKAKAVGVLFNWDDNIPQKIITVLIDNPSEYVSGEFYKRELPCLLKLIEQVDIKHIEVIIIDGYVYIDNEFNAGLGSKLWQALGEKTPVIGVAKTSFMSNKKTVAEVLRGESKNPLFISSVGTSLDTAAANISQMKGSHRIPDILKLMDKKTKEA